MWTATLEQITIEDVERLVTEEEQETLSLEFKQQLPQGGDEDRREFLYDVAAMANAAGGFLVYGIAEKRDAQGKPTGTAGEIAGLPPENILAEVARLENMIRDGIAPRLSGTVIKVLSGPQGTMLILSIPRSWNAPHMVTFKQANKFYRRVESGKYPMSIDEIRRAFSQGTEFTEAISTWRDRRLERTRQNKGPYDLRHGPAMVFHVIPASAFAQSSLSTTWQLSQQRRLEMHCPSVIFSEDGRYNGDGFLKFVNMAGAPTTGYTQVFRNGIIEYVTAGFSWNDQGQPGNATDVFTKLLEQELISSYRDAVKTYSELQITAPLYATVAVFGLSGRRMYIGPYRVRALPFMRDDEINLPEILLDKEQPLSVLKVFADFLWQAGGLESTPSLNQEGGWDPFINR